MIDDDDDNHDNNTLVGKKTSKKCISLFAEFILFMLFFVWLRYAIHHYDIIISCVESVINVRIDFILANNEK